MRGANTPRRKSFDGDLPGLCLVALREDDLEDALLELGLDPSRRRSLPTENNQRAVAKSRDAEDEGCHIGSRATSRGG